MRVSPLESAARSSTRFESDLEPGRLIEPDSVEIGLNGSASIAGEAVIFGVFLEDWAHARRDRTERMSNGRGEMARVSAEARREVTVTGEAKAIVGVVE